MSSWTVIAFCMWENVVSTLVSLICDIYICRSDPPSQSVSIATQELLRLTEANPGGLPGLDPLKDLHLRDIELVEKFRALELMKEKFSTFNCINCPRFSEHVSDVSQLLFNNKIT